MKILPSRRGGIEDEGLQTGWYASSRASMEALMVSPRVGPGAVC